MTDHKFTDEEIIKALVCCASYDCNGCPLYSPTINCVIVLPEKALELVEKQRAEIERLSLLLEASTEVIGQYQKDAETARSEAIKEFAERLKGKAEFTTIAGYRDYCRLINNLVKEMTEGKND